jgi:hypothetical protein
MVNRLSKESIWRNGYFLALFLLIVIGSLLIWVGSKNYLPGSFMHIFLVGLGTSMAPAAIIGLLFRIFLFQEIRYQLFNEQLFSSINEEIIKIIEPYREEINVIKSLKTAGVILPFERRERAIKYFSSAIDEETDEIMIIGSSLKGLLLRKEYKEIAEKLKFKISTGNVNIQFMLTHPIFADFRAKQEDRAFQEIGKEIIASLETLKSWNVPVENIRLFKGTPTCFAIKTSKYMLLNSYPYCKESYNSPCFIIKTDEHNTSYIYDAFKASHFSAWQSTLSERFSSYDVMIQNLRNNLPVYDQNAKKILGGQPISIDDE